MWASLREDFGDLVATVAGDTKEAFQKLHLKDELDKVTSLAKNLAGVGDRSSAGSSPTSEVLALQSDPRTFTEPVDQAEEQRFRKYLAKLNLSDRAADIEQLLNDNDDLADLYDELVEGGDIPSDLFWQRYFYRLEQMPAGGDASKGRREGLGGWAEEEEELSSWGDEETLEIEGQKERLTVEPVKSQSQVEMTGRSLDTAIAQASEASPDLHVPQGVASEEMRVSRSPAAPAAEPACVDVVVEGADKGEMESEVRALREEVVRLRMLGGQGERSGLEGMEGREESPIEELGRLREEVERSRRREEGMVEEVGRLGRAVEEMERLRAEAVRLTEREVELGEEVERSRRREEGLVEEVRRLSGVGEENERLRADVVRLRKREGVLREQVKELDGALNKAEGQVQQTLEGRQGREEDAGASVVEGRRESEETETGPKVVRSGEEGWRQTSSGRCKAEVEQVAGGESGVGRAATGEVDVREESQASSGGNGASVSVGEEDEMDGWN